MKLNKTYLSIFLLCCLTVLLYIDSSAIPKYSDGSLSIMGIRLLQDDKDQNVYYYVPQFPVISKKKDGKFEFQFLKYVGEDSESSGAIFHALFRFDMPQVIVQTLEKELKKSNPKAKIVGSVQILENQKKGLDDDNSSFQVISSVASQTDSTFTRSLISSGHAPFIEGSKSAISFALNEQGATLMEQSLQSSISDVSVSVAGYYEAVLVSYNAVVKANVENVYKHLSSINNRAQKFTRRQIQKATDSMLMNNTIKVEVFDRSKSVNLPESKLKDIQELIMEKLIAVFFDTENGWSKNWETEQAVVRKEIDRRGDEKSKAEKIINAISEGATNAATLGISGMLKDKSRTDKDYEFINNKEYLLKDVEKIKTVNFELNLNEKRTIKVPFATTGNLGGFIEENNSNSDYFKVVSMKDKDFQRKNIYCTVNSNYTDCFKDLVAFAKVKIKGLSEKNEYEHELVFGSEEVAKGNIVKELPNLMRLGDTSRNWGRYEYQVEWHIPNKNLVLYYPSKQQWQKSSSSQIEIYPPLEKKQITLVANPEDMKSQEVRSVVVQLGTVLNNEPIEIKSVIFRPDEDLKTVTIYKDKNAPIVSLEKWQFKSVQKNKELYELDGTSMYLNPPINE